MENASKALIIAGAILLAILLISLGIVIYTQAQDTIGSINMSEQEIQAFNNKFIKFEGDNKRGAEANQLVQLVRANNETAASDGAKEKIINISGTVTGYQPSAIFTTNTTTGEIVPTSGHGVLIASGAKVKIKFTYEKGLIHTITISP